MTTATRMTDWSSIPDMSFYGQPPGFPYGYGYSPNFNGSYASTFTSGFGGDSDLLFGSGVSGGWADVVNPEIVTAGATAAAQGADFYGETGNAEDRFRHLYMSDCSATPGAGSQNCAGAGRGSRGWVGMNFWPDHYAPGFLGFTEGVKGEVSTGASQVTLSMIQSSTAVQNRISLAVAALQADALKGLSSDWFVNKTIYEHSAKSSVYPYGIVPAVRVNTLSVTISIASRSDYSWNAELYYYNTAPYAFVTLDAPQYHHFSWVHTHGDMVPISIPAYAWRGVTDANIPTDYARVDLTSQLPHTWMELNATEQALLDSPLAADRNQVSDVFNTRMISPGGGFVIGMFLTPDYTVHGGYPPWLWAGANGGLEYGPREGAGFAGNKPVQALCYATQKAMDYTISVPRVRFELATNAIQQTITGGFSDDGRQFRRPR